MIRAACADEKTMRTYIGKIEYIKLFWEGAPEGEPAVILYEVDTENERLAHRSIDIFADGRTHNIPDPVSYTHLDVYKRQEQTRHRFGC